MTDSTSHKHHAASVRVEGVNLSYGATHVLKDVNLAIDPGEFFAFLGPSGCGKTTLLRLIAGFNVAQTGRVFVAGEDIGALPPWKRDVGMVFQSYALWPHMTVRQNVAFGLEERKVPKAQTAARVSDALEMVGLASLGERYPAQLSGGQQQRVALARTIVVRPKVLLLDEPLSNLDAKMRVDVRRELRDLQQRLGITTIFVTHDQEEANTICDRIAVMKDGIIQQVGAPMDLYERPANLFVAGFLGSANILNGTLLATDAGKAFELESGARIALPADMATPQGAKLVFRPQHAALDRSGSTPGLRGVIRHREFLGSTVRYIVSAGSQEILVDLPFHSAGDLAAEGSTVTVIVPPQQMQLLAG